MRAGGWPKQAQYNFKEEEAAGVESLADVRYLLKEAFSLKILGLRIALCLKIMKLHGELITDATQMHDDGKAPTRSGHSGPCGKGIRSRDWPEP